MKPFTTVHLHNVPDDKVDAYADWFDGEHRVKLGALRGFSGAERYEVAEGQVMSHIPQPWRFASVYDFDLQSPEVDIPALGPLLADVRDNGMIADDGTERIYTYKMFSDWQPSSNWQSDKPFSGVSILLGNYTPGRYQEYQDWYENVHAAEVTGGPGHVAMKRGELYPVQIEPRHYCPGDQLVLAAQQTDDLPFCTEEFAARGTGKSPSGKNHTRRSSSASIARTVHYFTKISGTEFWPGGTAYDGDWSVYPGRS